MKKKNNKYVNVFVFFTVLIGFFYFLSKNAKESSLYQEGMIGPIIFVLGLPALIIWGLIAWSGSSQKKSKNKKKILSKYEKVKNEDSIDNSLVASLKRLKKLYNDGNLNKAEFEKAKNKLLK